MKRKVWLLPAVAALMAPALAACGGPEAAGGQSGTTIVVGTTDQLAPAKGAAGPLDPAGVYDIGGWNILGNIFQTLMSYPRAGTEPVPDAANDCSFTNPYQQTTYGCDLRDGLHFSNGDPLTSADVKYSIDRQLAIHNSNGPAGLLAGVRKVTTEGPSRVVFQLKSPDATFPLKLATPAAAIVDRKIYPAHSLYTGYRLVGSGPYVLDSWKPGQEADFSRNAGYQGTFTVNNDHIRLRFFNAPGQMVDALKSGTIDVIGRTMTPGEIAALDDNASSPYTLVEAPGTETRYLVFNMSDPTAGKYAVRKAIAQSVDRQALVRDVYARTSQALYSMIPQGIIGHTNSFFDLYHEPSPSAARATLAAAHVPLPVHLTMTYTTDHYGSSTAQEFAELQRQLEATGLFDVSVKGVPWSTFEPAADKGRYAVYGMGWFPDFPDPDNYLTPFFGKDNFLGNSYRNATIEQQIIPAEQRTADRGSTTDGLVRAQRIIAQQIPFLPLWQGNQYLAARSGITGTEWALNASSQMQFWELGRGRPTDD